LFTRENLQRNCRGRLRRVSDDWIRALPREKSEIFDSIVHRWECSLAMTSVALDDALSMRARGELVCAGQQVELSAVLLGRLSSALISFCDGLVRRARYIRETPAVEPLNAAFFQGDAAQTAADWNTFLHHVVFGERPRFINKLKILSNTIQRIEQDFGSAVEQISKAGARGACWMRLDALHYDFTTCLRETEIVLKSFLRALAADELAAFSFEAPATPAKRLRVRPRFSRATA
jgi:hypothetical protein